MYTVTSKAQVTIPKKVRDALKLSPGSSVEFSVNDACEVVLRTAGRKLAGKRDRFESLRGKAQIKWRTSDLTALLRE